jgi:hypothetical protein
MATAWRSRRNICSGHPLPHQTRGFEHILGVGIIARRSRRFHNDRANTAAFINGAGATNEISSTLIAERLHLIDRNHAARDAGERRCGLSSDFRNVNNSQVTHGKPSIDRCANKGTHTGRPQDRNEPPPQAATHRRVVWLRSFAAAGSRKRAGSRSPSLAAPIIRLAMTACDTEAARCRQPRKPRPSPQPPLSNVPCKYGRIGMAPLPRLESMEFINFRQCCETVPGGLIRSGCLLVCSRNN